MGQGFIYKWEENNHGLDHKCGTCQTVLSSPRAKTTCFGKHEEVCSKYHKTLFFIGNSHKCDACRKSTELHDKRHREIYALVQRFSTSEETGTFESPLLPKKKKTRKSDSPAVLNKFEDSVGEVEVERQDQWDDSSSVMDDDVDTKRLKNPGGNTIASTKKAKKAELKLVKNQSRVRVISSRGVEKISRALHLTDISLLEDTNAPQNYSVDALLTHHNIIFKNLAFNSNTFKYSSLREGFRLKRIVKNNGTPEALEVDPIGLENPEVINVFSRLGIKIASAQLSKERKSTIVKLANAIQNDLTIVENEDRDTMMRMAGYWRYVNKRTYNEMIRNNELWDWSSGEKLEPIEEIDEVVESLPAIGNGTAETEKGTPNLAIENYDVNFVVAERKHLSTEPCDSIADCASTEICGIGTSEANIATRGKCKVVIQSELKKSPKKIVHEKRVPATQDSKLRSLRKNVYEGKADTRHLHNAVHHARPASIFTAPAKTNKTENFGKRPVFNPLQAYVATDNSHHPYGALAREEHCNKDDLNSCHDNTIGGEEERRANRLPSSHYSPSHSSKRRSGATKSPPKAYRIIRATSSSANKGEPASKVTGAAHARALSATHTSPKPKPQAWSPIKRRSGLTYAAMLRKDLKNL